MDGAAVGLSVASFIAAAAVSFGLLLWLKPLLARYALAKPNARSSHKEPTPQGGGLAVIAAAIIVAAPVEFFFVPHLDESLRLQLTVLLASTVGLALLGVIDDVRPLGAAPRLVLQTVAVAAVIAALPHEMRIVPAVPWWLDRALALVGGVWLVNLVNFMDGIDWMTVAEIIPVTAALAVFGLMGALPPGATLVAVAVCGAMVGFAPMNRPIATVFLGDVGSLPIALLLGWLLALLAGNGHLVSAILLPLYYLADATITLIRRLVNGERITEAHRGHFYQRALDGGLSVFQIVGRVLAVNLALAGLAAISLSSHSPIVKTTALVGAVIIVGALLWTFDRAASRPKR
jgi:UDP-N-acetylmuramyl pentapeptide phosphotransferase/UDP-N-acetylglucosamine-1-phosphate transferase